MAEEEIGHGGRGGRGRSPARASRGGATLGVKAALVTGGAALVIAILVLLAAQGGQTSPQESMDQAGYAAVQALSGTSVEWWTGGAPAGETNAVKQAHRVFVDLFGQKGKDWWRERVEFIEQAYGDGMDPEVETELKEAKATWFDGTDKWEKGGNAKGGNKTARRTLQQIAAASRVVNNPAYRFKGAWIREAKGEAEGTPVASFPDANNIAYDWSKRPRNAAKVDGRVGGEKVTIYAASMDAPPGARKQYRAYVALRMDPRALGGGPSNLGIVLAILGPLVVGGLAFTIANAHTKNVRSLAREIDRLGSSGDPTRVLRTQSGEAAFVARAVERMVGNLEFRSKHDDADLDQIADKEKKVAEEIHGALMSKHPPRLSDWEVETLYKPGFEIAGDHFEYFPIDEHHLGVILLDTNVRGIPAALVMASARSYVRAAAPGELSPAAVLKTVNKNLAGDLPPGRHVTALYVVIDVREGKATMASAGHLPLIVYRHASGGCAKVNPEGIALGLDPGPVFDRSLQEGDIPIGVGDRIVLYTDGALNIADEYGEEFGEGRFYETVTREAPKNSQAFVNFVGGTIDQFHLNTPQNDDVTISTVKRLK